MKEETFKYVKREVKKLYKKYKDIIEFVYIYGSAITKDNPNDIDIMFVMPDENLDITKLKKFKSDYEELYKTSKKKGTLIHIQSPKPISLWWKMILEGEPWVIDGLRNIMVLHDKKKIAEEVSELINRGILFGKEEKAEKFLNRSELYLIKNREVLLRSINLLSEAATEAAQILLLFDNKLILNKEKLSRKLHNYLKKKDEELLNTYKEIIDLEDKMEKGNLTDFSVENLEHYKTKVTNFIQKIEKIITSSK